MTRPLTAPMGVLPTSTANEDQAHPSLILLLAEVRAAYQGRSDTVCRLALVERMLKLSRGEVPEPLMVAHNEKQVREWDARSRMVHHIVMFRARGDDDDRTAFERDHSAGKP